MSVKTSRLGHAQAAVVPAARIAPPWVCQQRAVPRSQSLAALIPAAQPLNSPPGSLGDCHLALLVAVEECGGRVHPSLRPAPGGGVLAAADIPTSSVPLVELPLSLRLTPEAAQELLLPSLTAAGLPTLCVSPSPSHKRALCVHDCCAPRCQCVVCHRTHSCHTIYPSAAAAEHKAK